ncbi:hypothetical protein D3C72_2430720 [compost metagenome]
MRTFKNLTGLAIAFTGLCYLQKDMASKLPVAIGDDKPAKEGFPTIIAIEQFKDLPAAIAFHGRRSKQPTNLAVFCLKFFGDFRAGRV